MRIEKLALALTLLVSALTARASDELYGTWKLVSSTREEVATGTKTNNFGDSPQGFLSYSRDGRMYGILARDGRPKPADMSKVSNEQRVELFNTMAAYAGTFKVDGKTVTHHVDISWNENWTGTAQKRQARLDGQKLFISTDPITSGTDGKLVVFVLEWHKVVSQ